MNLQEEIEKIKQDGYSELNAVARLCQDVVLYAISRSSLRRNVTVKGGVVMRSLSNNVRRATQDLDLDFIKYPISDEFGNRYDSKVDLGVHKDLDIEQKEYCFDVCCQEDGASLLMNSAEQMIAEKLKSLARFRATSTRYKDMLSVLSRLRRIGWIYQLQKFLRELLCFSKAWDAYYVEMEIDTASEPGVAREYGE